jgi:hypothetical protein
MESKVEQETLKPGTLQGDSEIRAMIRTFSWLHRFLLNHVSSGQSATPTRFQQQPEPMARRCCSAEWDSNHQVLALRSLRSSVKFRLHRKTHRRITASS